MFHRVSLAQNFRISLKRRWGCSARADHFVGLYLRGRRAGFGRAVVVVSSFFTDFTVHKFRHCGLGCTHDCYPVFNHGIH